MQKQRKAVTAVVEAQKENNRGNSANPDAIREAYQQAAIDSVADARENAAIDEEVVQEEAFEEEGTAASRCGCRRAADGTNAGQ